LKFDHWSCTFYWVSIWFCLKNDLTLSLTFNGLILFFHHTIHNFQPRFFSTIIVFSISLFSTINLTKSWHLWFFRFNQWGPVVFNCILLWTKYWNFFLCQMICIRISGAFHFLIMIIFKDRVLHHFLTKCNEIYLSI
jgi:hypothetical protein